MVLPTGQIGMDQVNTELSVTPSSTQISLNDTPVRNLAGAPFATPGTQISMDDLRGKSAVPPAVNATGGTTFNTPDGYRLHVFTAPGNFTVTAAGPGTVEVFLVGGGGNGHGVASGPGAATSRYANAGGGGRAFTSPAPVTTTPGVYPIVIGTGNPAPSNPATQAPSSTALGLTAPGGWPGGGPGAVTGTNGSPTFPTAGDSGPPGPTKGGAGFYTPSNNALGSGGGGAGGAGVPVTPGASARAGQGGLGVAAFSGWINVPASYGTPGPGPGRYFAGGGGGGPNLTTVAPPTGPWPSTRNGLAPAGGGGGAGAPGGPGRVITGGSATTNTGGGGGGAAYQNGPAGTAPAANGGAGAPGIVMIRYIR